MNINFESWHFVEVDGELVGGFPLYNQAVAFKRVVYGDAENVGICTIAEYQTEKISYNKNEIIEYANHNPQFGNFSDKIVYIKVIRHLYNLTLREALEIYERLWK